MPDLQSEDCLTLNVFTPALKALPGAPVMVFFHGGSFTAGSAPGPWNLYDGARMAARGGVVVVTAQYRLDAFGWLVTTAEPAARGNFGLLDQRAALRWVQDNIGAFGGDPARVTLWGESAGAMAAVVHAFSPPSEGLFDKLLLESNVAGFAFSTPKFVGVYGDDLTAKAGCNKPPAGQSTLDCLREVPFPVLANISAAVIQSYYDIARGSGFTLLDGALQWGPVLDDLELPEQPMAAVQRGAWRQKLDLLMGYNTDEVATFLDASSYAQKFPKTLYTTVMTTVFGVLGQLKVEKQYAPYALPAGVEKLDRIFTDFWFRCAGQTMAGSLSSAGGQAWVYRFNQPLSFGPQIFGPYFGLPQCATKICHTGELPFAFGNSGLWQFADAEVAFVDTIQDFWSNFAHSGNPNVPRPGAGTARSLLAPSWPAFDSLTRSELILDGSWATEGDENGNCAFFDTQIGYANT